jgi:hypothetical protein
MKRRRWAILLCFLASCSTHPLTDFWDFVKPGTLGKTTVQPYGGVGVPQGAIVPVAPSLPGAVVTPVPGGGVIPGPLPLPGSRPPEGFQLQPPTFPNEIPLPPDPPRKF